MLVTMKDIANATGRRIPKELSLIGYDSLLFAKASNQRLEVERVEGIRW